MLLRTLVFVSGFTKGHQGHMLNLNSIFQKEDLYTCGGREGEVLQLLLFTVGIESLLCRNLIFSLDRTGIVLMYETNLIVSESVGTDIFDG